MASSRIGITFEDMYDQTLTFNIDGTTVTADTNRYNLGNGSAEIGMMVELVSDATIGLGTTAHYPLGKLIKVETDGVCSVVTAGVVGVPYVALNANPPLVGRGVQIDGAGNVITPSGGTRLATERGQVLHLDSTNQICYVRLW